MESILNQLIVMGKVAVAAILGGFIGYERELKDKPAGLRTHMLVSAASCAIMLVGTHILVGYQDEKHVMADPIRIVQAIVLGIGFIGGGVVTAEGGAVKNLTTAASILFVAIVGISIALDQFVVGVMLTAMSLLITSGLVWVERRIRHREDDS